MSLFSRILPFRKPPYRLINTYEHQLGTELEVQVVAESRDAALNAEQLALAEQVRLAAILNRFDPDSELRRWMERPVEKVYLSPELLEVLAMAEDWQQRSGGAFHAGADALGTLWKRAAEEGATPEGRELAEICAELRSPLWTSHGDGSATLHTTRPIGLNALAKGYIVDRMAQAAFAAPGVEAVVVNAGGDLRVMGVQPLRVGVADCFTARDDAPPLGYVTLTDTALASSGSAHRGYRIGERWYSHVLDPRTGYPVDEVPGVTVIAPTCAVADALATVLGVLDIPAGLALVEREAGAAALIVDRSGRQTASSRWPSL